MARDYQHRHATVLVVRQSDGLTVWIEEVTFGLMKVDFRRQMSARDVEICHRLAREGVNDNLALGCGIRFMVDWATPVD